ncbi:hypothetical protein M9H77_10222 [Catharanthus roseus]|uniref:Uncharacterized protein n=1 Tax=Catharanthus roseus TaxID=4058 RepID=A0ACC0C370_CATRO|nr:hypothetical protein M9H77_10222 [Catharanthus roseus]
MMNPMARRFSTIFDRPATSMNPLCCELQQWRGIRVQVRNGNLERALSLMQRIMVSSGIERMIKREQTHHIKNSEKRVLARKSLQRRIQSQDFSRKLKSVLLKKVSFMSIDYRKKGLINQVCQAVVSLDQRQQPSSTILIFLKNQFMVDSCREVD